VFPLERGLSISEADCYAKPMRYDDDDELDDDDEGYDVDEDGGDDDDDDVTIPCPYCRRQIHEDAERCPYCEQYISAEDAPSQPKP
jgi:hypothetical protein